MPTYEYECDACHHAFEKFQSITAQPVRKCPNCGRRRVRRLIGAGAAILFKGSGFHETDYRSDDYKKRAKADTDAGSSKPDGAASAKDGAKPSSKSSSGGKTNDAKPKA